jgi:hypothetical protein
MTDYPARGQTAPAYWDLQLHDWILEQIAAGGAVHSRGEFYPEDYAVGSISYPNDAISAWNAAMAAAAAAGGGLVVGSDLYGMGDGDITQLNGVDVEFRGGTVGPAPGDVGFKATHANARYRWGNHTGNPYPGTIRGMTIDGDNIANECFRAEATETSAYDLHVFNAVIKCVDAASSQNVNFINPNFGSCTEGTSLLLKAKQAGAQPPGHCVFFGGHIGDSKRSLHVTSFDSSFFVGPHDNYFIGTIFETGRSAYDIDDIISLEDGDTHFVNCVFTVGSQVTAINNDAAVRLINSIRTTASTTATFSDCSFGGGAGAVKATYGVRVINPGGSVSNAVNYSVRRTFANVTYAHCHDGGDGLITAEGPYVPVTAVTDEFQTINGGALAGVLKQTRFPVRFLGRADTGSGFQTRRDTDTVANRWQVDRDGKHSWLDGAAGAIRGTLQRVLAGGLHFMTMGGTWLAGGGWGRTLATSTLAADAAVAIDASLDSSHLLNFTATGADVTALTITNGFIGAELRIAIFGTGVNTISWPADAAGGIHPNRTLPQPLDGQMQFIDLHFINDRWYEVNRSVKRGDKTINAQTGTTYTVGLTDAEPDAMLTLSNASAITLTIPANATTAFPIGSYIEGLNIGAGDVTITPAGGVTLTGDPGLKVTAQPGGFGLLKTGTNTWQAIGKLST